MNIEEKYDNIIKILYKTCKGSLGNESITNILIALNSSDKTYIKFIKDNFDDFRVYLSIKTGEELSKIAEPDREQVGKLIAVLMEINLERIVSVENVQLIKKINDELAKYNVGLEVKVSSEIQTILKKIQAFELIKRCLRLINQYDTALSILPYAKYFSTMSVNELKANLAELEGMIQNTKISFIVEEEAKKLAIAYLTKTGHPLSTIKDKDPSSLVDIMAKHYFAGLSVYYYREVNKNIDLDKSRLTDAIALFLLDHEDLTATD